MTSNRLTKLRGRSFSAIMAFLVLWPSLGQARLERMPISDAISNEIIQVLEIADHLNNAFVEEDFTVIDEKLNELLQVVKGVRRQIGKLNQKILVLPILRHLDAIARHIEVALASDGEIRSLELKNTFNQVAGLVKAYELPKEYRIFFCHSDGVTWMQKGRRAKNPMNPKSQCGISVL